MSAADHEFRTARNEDLPGVVALLKACGLPTDDLGSVNLEHFELAIDVQGRIAGIAGFDRADGDALLRSLAVAPDWRGRGLGDALVARREAAAKRAGVSRFFSADDERRRLLSQLGLPRRGACRRSARHRRARAIPQPVSGQRDLPGKAPVMNRFVAQLPSALASQRASSDE